MTINEVESMYQNILNEASAPISIFASPLNIAYICAGIMIVLLIILSIVLYKFTEFWDNTSLSLCFMSFVSVVGVTFSFSFLVSGGLSDDPWKENSARQDQVDQQIKTWKMSYAEPYIASLPQQKRELIYIKIDPESQAQSVAIATWGGSAAYTSSETQTSMVLSYVDGENIVTQTLPVVSKMDLSAKDKPYVTFVRLDHPIGANQRSSDELNGVFVPDKQYSVGNYRYTVHLPKGYTFTTIQ